MITNISYTFVIDTDSYAGNFCREMCAYMTGAIGECGVGQKERSTFFEEMDLENEEFIDENGPLLDSVRGPDGLITKNLIGMEANEHGVMRPCKEVPNPNWVNDGNGNHTKIENKSEPEWPAFLSVGIILNLEPEKSKIKLMKERAHKFAAINKFQIEGFRLITITTTETSESI